MIGRAGGLAPVHFVIGLLFTVAACGNDVPASPIGTAVAASDVFLARHRDLGGGPAALVIGQLVVQDGCLLIDGESGLEFASWPGDAFVWSVDGETVLTDGSGRVITHVGDRVKFTGGHDYSLEFVQSLNGAPIPSTCQTGRYAIINDLRLLPGE